MTPRPEAVKKPTPKPEAVKKPSSCKTESRPLTPWKPSRRPQL